MERFVEVRNCTWMFRRDVRRSVMVWVEVLQARSQGLSLPMYPRAPSTEASQYTCPRVPPSRTIVSVVMATATEIAITDSKRTPPRLGRRRRYWHCRRALESILPPQLRPEAYLRDTNDGPYLRTGATAPFRISENCMSVRLQSSCAEPLLRKTSNRPSHWARVRRAIDRTGVKQLAVAAQESLRPRKSDMVEAVYYPARSIRLAQKFPSMGSFSLLGVHHQQVQFRQDPASSAWTLSRPPWLRTGSHRYTSNGSTETPPGGLRSPRAG